MSQKRLSCYIFVTLREKGPMFRNIVLNLRHKTINNGKATKDTGS